MHQSCAHFAVFQDSETERRFEFVGKKSRKATYNGKTDKLELTRRNMKAFKSFVLVVCVCLILNGNVASAIDTGISMGISLYSEDWINLCLRIMKKMALPFKPKEKHNVQPPQPLKDKAPLSKSTAYKELRDSGILVLPKRLRNQTSKHFDIQRCHMLSDHAFVLESGVCARACLQPLDLDFGLHQLPKLTESVQTFTGLKFDGCRRQLSS
ncbi:Hypothetical predicted protein, partial [Paramuricea clavata]